MSVLLFESEILAKEKAEEFLKNFPIGFTYKIQKKFESEKYFIVGFEDKEKNIQLRFLDDLWYATHLNFEDVNGFSDCPMSAIKSLRTSLLSKIKEYEEELIKMNKNKERNWFYGFS